MVAHEIPVDRQIKIDCLQSYFDNGMPQIEMAKKFGVNKSTITKWKQKWGITEKPGKECPLPIIPPKSKKVSKFPIISSEEKELGWDLADVDPFYAIPVPSTITLEYVEKKSLYASCKDHIDQCKLLLDILYKKKKIDGNLDNPLLKEDDY